MSNRNSILEKIKNNKPDLVELKEVHGFGNQQKSTSLFIETLQSIKTEAVCVNNISSIITEVQSLQNEGKIVVNLLEDISEETKNNISLKTAADLASVDYAFVKGQIAVTENGAIWVSDKNIINRLVPFICQHLILVIEEKNIVADMHEAYASIQINNDGYGVFISGPSKTADIEQSLVIGAHGPLSLKVFILQ